MSSNSLTLGVVVILLGAMIVPLGILGAPLVNTSPTTSYAVDFNADNGGWTASPVTEPPRPAPVSSWAWGTPTSGPSKAHSGTKAWATNLAGLYGNSECGALLSPPIDLTGVTSASVSFMHWRHFELSSTTGTAWDAGVVMVTTDGGKTLTVLSSDYNTQTVSSTVRTCFNGAPTTLRGFTGPAGTTLPAATYALSSVNLDAYAGKTVQVLLAFGSDGSGQRNGWYVDDFTVTKDGVGVTETFETTNGGFTLTGTKVAPAGPKGWSWGVPTTGPGANATGMWATNPAGDHGPNECAWVESAPITLTGSGSALQDSIALSWRQWFKTSSTAAGVVQVGTDAGYTNIAPTTGYNNLLTPNAGLDACLGHVTQGSGAFSGTLNTGTGMTDYVADLTSWMGQTVTLRFLFASTSSTLTNEGWYVDDVDVQVRSGLSGPDLDPLVEDLPAAPSAPGSVSFQPLATAYAEDFELGDGGFTKGGITSWAYGTATSPPSPAVGQGPSLWGTNLAGDYGNGECGWLQSPALDLSGYAPAPETGVSAARLLFNHWLHAESRFDGGVVMASKDGTEWSLLTPVGGYNLLPHTSARTCFGLSSTQTIYTSPSSSPAPAAEAWNLAEFDVTSYLGGDLHVRWVFASDNSVVKRGWYVDDVLVQIGAGSNLKVEPGSVIGGPVNTPFTPLQVAYAEDFEVDGGGWQVTGTATWEWGAPASPPVTVPGSLNVWGTRLAGNYLASECSTLTGPAFTLPGADTGAGVDTARLALKMWRHMENGYEGLLLQASSDAGATWSTVTPHGGYDRTLSNSGVRACLGVSASDLAWSGPSTAPKAEEWTDVYADLTAYMGKTIQLRFVFASDPSVHYRGAYIDDVIVHVGAGATPPALPVGSNGGLAAPGWTITGAKTSWSYGFATVGPTSATPVWATNLHGNYLASECGAIVSPPIVTSTVPGEGRLVLRFEHSMTTASTDDGGMVQVSTDDGATWIPVTPVNGYPSNLGTNARACAATGASTQPGFASNTPAGFQAREVRLDAFDGADLRVRFVFGSGPSSENLGWTVRGVTVGRETGAAVPLTASASLSAADLDALTYKADAALEAAAKAGTTEALTVLVVGRDLGSVKESLFTSRAGAMGYLDARAAPFFTSVKQVTELGGGSIVATWGAINTVKVKADLPLLAALAAREDVEALILDFDGAVRLVTPLEDDSVSASNTQGRAQLQAEDIWALGYRGEGIRISIIDTGLDPRHEAFKYADGSSRVLAFVDYVNGRAVSYDDYGHGTHVGGTSLGSNDYTDPTWGAFQEVGVAPKAQLLVAKFLSASGSGTFEAAISSLQWSFDNGADITSNSWGGSCTSGAVAVLRAVRQLTDLGMLSVFAAGNSGSGASTIGSPACGESSLSVGAIDNTMAIATFSSRGPCTDIELATPSRICPDVVAKGVAVRSAIPRDGAAQADATGYKTWQGTSMATPHISGAVALAEQMKRSLTGTGWDTSARAEEQVFKMTALDLGASGEDNTFGWGLPQLLNVYAMVSATDEAKLVTTFGISKAVLRQGDTSTLTFSVRNLGGAAATGGFLATLTAPDSTVTTLRESTVTLGLLDGEVSTTLFSATGSALPGTYTFRGVFTYSWTNSTSNETVTGEIVREGVFDVKRVFVTVALDGFDGEALPGELQQVRFTATNTGNEPASNVVIEFTVPDKYAFVPGTNYDPNVPTSRYADPAPTSVKEDKNFGRVTLVYNVGGLAEGDSFSFNVNLAATALGDFRVLTIAKFADGAGKPFSQGIMATQTVGVNHVVGLP